MARRIWRRFDKIGFDGRTLTSPESATVTTKSTTGTVIEADIATTERAAGRLYAALTDASYVKGNIYVASWTFTHVGGTEQSVDEYFKFPGALWVWRRFDRITIDGRVLTSPASATVSTATLSGTAIENALATVEYATGHLYAVLDETKYTDGTDYIATWAFTHTGGTAQSVSEYFTGSTGLRRLLRRLKWAGSDSEMRRFTQRVDLIVKEIYETLDALEARLDRMPVDRDEA